jgi:hypothetical protein
MFGYGGWFVGIILFGRPNGVLRLSLTTGGEGALRKFLELVSRQRSFTKLFVQGRSVVQLISVLRLVLTINGESSLRMP